MRTSSQRAGDSPASSCIRGYPAPDAPNDGLGVKSSRWGAEVVHALVGFGGSSLDRFFSDELYLGIETAGVLLCAARAAFVPEQRVAWWCLAAGFACWTGGDLAWTLVPARQSG